MRSRLRRRSSEMTATTRMTAVGAPRSVNPRSGSWCPHRSWWRLTGACTGSRTTPPGRPRASSTTPRLGNSSPHGPLRMAGPRLVWHWTRMAIQSYSRPPVTAATGRSARTTVPARSCRPRLCLLPRPRQRASPSRLTGPPSTSARDPSMAASPSTRTTVPGPSPHPQSPSLTSTQALPHSISTSPPMDA